MCIRDRPWVCGAPALVFRGGDSGYFFEGAGEIGDITVSYHLRHLIYFVTAIVQELHGGADAVSGDVGHDGVVGLLFKQVA